MFFLLHRLSGNKNFETKLSSQVAGVGLAAPRAVRDSKGVLENIIPDFVLCVSNRAAVQGGLAATSMLDMSKGSCCLIQHHHGSMGSHL